MHQKLWYGLRPYRFAVAVLKALAITEAVAFSEATSCRSNFCSNVGALIESVDLADAVALTDDALMP